MARFVGALYRQQLHDFTEMRMHLAEMTRRNQQCSVLIFDQISHHLNDSILDILWNIDRLSPVDGRLRIPLACQCLLVKLGSGVSPDLGFIAETKIEARTARLNRGPARGDTPARICMFCDGAVDTAVRLSAALRTVPATQLERTARDQPVVFGESHGMTVASAPSQQVHVPVGRAGIDTQRATDLDLIQRALDQQVRTLIESERINIDSRLR